MTNKRIIKSSNELKIMTKQEDDNDQGDNYFMSLVGDFLKENNNDSSILNSDGNSSSSSPSSFFAIGLASAFVFAHGAIILSLPPVIRGNGAPFLPTTSKNMDRMFKLIKQQPQIRHKLEQKKMITSSVSSGMKFVDLGSGDGRMVFRSAREPNLFQYSIGYEINPVLHMFAQSRRIFQYSTYYSNTLFYRKDLWRVKLSNIDVIAVYGLYPIMDRLGKKICDEATPGTIVVSNLFQIPGWKPISVDNGVYLYCIPESLV